MSGADRRAVIVQHQDEAPAGVLGAWAIRHALEPVVVRPDRGEALPAPETVRFAVVLGSDHFAVPGLRDWIDLELDWLRAVVAADVPVLGICFGAQALAVALGGTRRRAVQPEIGWIDVDTADPDRIPAGPWFAWHEDVIDPPAGVEVLASNAAGVQAFALGAHLGVQFHPEVTRTIVAEWTARGHGQRPGRAADATERDGERAFASALAAHRLFDAFLARATAPVAEEVVA